MAKLVTTDACVPVLLYHSVDANCDTAYERWAVTPQEFGDHLKVLRDSGYNPITAATFAKCIRQGRPLGLQPIVVTFDDSLVDVIENAIPLLEKHKVPATFFTVSRSLGAQAYWLQHLRESRRRTLTANELKHVHSLGHEIGSHSRNHLELDLVSESRLRQEIYDSKAELQEAIGSEIETLAYPYGYSSKIARRLAEEAKYVAAFTVQNRVYRNGVALYSIPRLIVERGTGAAGVIKLIQKATPPNDNLTRKILVLGWRCTRFARKLSRSLIV